MKFIFLFCIVSPFAECLIPKEEWMKGEYAIFTDITDRVEPLLKRLVSPETREAINSIQSNEGYTRGGEEMAIAFLFASCVVSESDRSRYKDLKSQSEKQYLQILIEIQKLVPRLTDIQKTTYYTIYSIYMNKTLTVRQFNEIIMSIKKDTHKMDLEAVLNVIKEGEYIRDSIYLSADGNAF